MTDEMRKTINEIQRLAPQLNATTDLANATIARMEKFLNDECSIGLPTWETVEEEPQAKPENGRLHVRITRVGYARQDGKYRIVVSLEDWLGGEWEGEQVMAWSSCPRDVKLKTLRQVPRLLQAILDEASRITAEAKDAVTAIDDLFGALASQD